MFPIPIKLPTAFEDAVGYPYKRRWVALYWEPCGDEAVFNDGCCSADCNWWGFLKFKEHPNIRPWLTGYNLGSSDCEATHWLLCDLENRDFFVEKREVVARFLREENPAVTPVGLNYEPVDIKDFLAKAREALRQIPAPSIEDIERKIQNDQEAVEKMLDELDGWL